MGQAYSGLGLYKPAEDLLTQARADQNSATVPDESRVRTLVASGSTLYLAGKYDEAAKELREAVELARRTLRPSDALRSDALTWLADVLTQLEKYPEAIQLCEEALVADRKRGPAEAAVLARTLDYLATAYLDSGDLAAAEAPLRESLRIREQVLACATHSPARSLNELGALLYQSGDMTRPSRCFNKHFRSFGRSTVPNTPKWRPLSIRRTYRSDGGARRGSEPLFRQSLAMFRKFQGDNYDALVPPLNSLAMIDAYHGRLDVARSEIQRADAIARMPDQGELWTRCS